MCRTPSALYRLLGDEARLRLLRLLALERLNVTELTGILGIAQSGVSRHLGLLRDGGLVSEEREAASPTTASRRAVRDGRNGARAALGAARVAVRPAPRRPRPAAPTWPGSKKCGGCARRTSTRTRGPDTQRASARARPELGGVGAGARPPAAAAARRRSGLRRGLSDGRDEPLGVARDCRRSLGRRPEARAHARVAAPGLQRHLEARRAREAADPRRHRGRRAAVAGAASRRRSGPRDPGSRPHPVAGRPRAHPRSSRARRDVGARAARRPLARVFATRRCGGC